MYAYVRLENLAQIDPRDWNSLGPLRQIFFSPCTLKPKNFSWTCVNFSWTCVKSSRVDPFFGLHVDRKKNPKNFWQVVTGPHRNTLKACHFCTNITKFFWCVFMCRDILTGPHRNPSPTYQKFFFFFSPVYIKKKVSKKCFGWDLYLAYIWIANGDGLGSMIYSDLDQNP